MADYNYSDDEYDSDFEGFSEVDTQDYDEEYNTIQYDEEYNTAQDQSTMRENLMFAVRGGDNDLVKSLLNKGVNLNYSSGDRNELPLHVATRPHFSNAEANTELLELLVNFGAPVHARDRLGVIPLHIASKVSSEYVRILLGAGSYVNSSDDAGRTAMFYACKGRCPEALTIFQYLLDRGANVHVREQDGKTALHYICSNESMDETVRNEIVCKLLYAGLSVNDPDDYRKTPLLDQVDMLLSRGRNINFHDLCGLVLKTLVQGGGRLHNKLDSHVLISILIPMCHDYWHSSTATAVDKTKFSDNLEVLNLMMFCVPVAILKEALLVGNGQRCHSGDQPDSDPDYCPYSVFYERLHSLSFNATSLKYLSRTAIRAQLDGKVFPGVATLDLPLSLKDYILLKNI